MPTNPQTLSSSTFWPVLPFKRHTVLFFYPKVKGEKKTLRVKKKPKRVKGEKKTIRVKKKPRPKEAVQTDKDAQI